MTFSVCMSVLYLTYQFLNNAFNLGRIGKEGNTKKRKKKIKKELGGDRKMEEKKEGKNFRKINRVVNHGLTVWRTCASTTEPWFFWIFMENFNSFFPTRSDIFLRERKVLENLRRHRGCL